MDIEDAEFQKRLANRYQNQPWYIKAWRHVHYWKAPFLFLRVWVPMQIPSVKRKHKHPYDTTGFIWKISVSLATLKMEWWYTMDETMAHMKGTIDKYDDRPD